MVCVPTFQVLHALGARDRLGFARDSWLRPIRDPLAARAAELDLMRLDNNGVFRGDYLRVR
jgi:hypothetical protein